MTTKERIESDTEGYFNGLSYCSAISESEMKDGKTHYIAGATSERNKTIDEIYTLLEWHYDNGAVLQPDFIKAKLKELKIK